MRCKKFVNPRSWVKRYYTGGDLYKILGADSNASEADLKKKYFELAKKYHPDINPSADAKKKFIELNNAYEVLSDKQKRAQYDSQRQYGMGSDQPQSSYQYGTPRYQQQQSTAKRGPPRDDFEDILRFWNDMVQEENRKNQQRGASREWNQSTPRSSYQKTTIRRDANGNIRVETQSSGGSRNMGFDWDAVSRAGESIRKQRGKDFENTYKSQFDDPWKIFTNGDSARPTILEFPSKFSLLQSVKPANGSLGQYDIYSKSKILGAIKETSYGQLNFMQNNALLSQARFWRSKSGVEQGVVETKDGRKIATVIETASSPRLSLTQVLLSYFFTHYVIKNSNDQLIGYISSLNMFQNRIVFYDKSASPVVKVVGSINLFGYNIVEYSDVSIGIGSKFDPSLIITFSTWNSLKIQRAFNPIAGVITSLVEFGKGLFGKK